MSRNTAVIPVSEYESDIRVMDLEWEELLAGRTHFTGATPQSILAAHVTEQVDPVSKYRDHVFAKLDAVPLNSP